MREKKNAKKLNKILNRNNRVKGEKKLALAASNH